MAGGGEVWRRSAGFGVRRHVRARIVNRRGAAVSPVSLAKDAYGAVVRGVMLAITVEEEDGSSSCAREKETRLIMPQHTHNLREKQARHI